MTLKHPRLAHALMALRPAAKPLVDFVCLDDGDGQGPYLADGSMTNPPTQAEVDAVTTEQLDAAQQGKHKRTIADALASIGLTVDDLKSAIGSQPN